MGLKIDKSAYIQLIKEDLKYLNEHCPGGSLEKDHIKAVLCSSIDWYYHEQSKNDETLKYDIYTQGGCPHELSAGCVLSVGGGCRDCRYND